MADGDPGRRRVTTDEDLLAAFDDDDSGWPLATSDVSAAVEIDDVYRRLEALVDAGLLEKRKYGRSNAYRLTEAGREYLRDSD